MRPIFRDLSHPDLLKKCLHGKTQNPNESFHNVVWSRVPKATFVQSETLSLGVYDAVCSFNDGVLRVTCASLMNNGLVGPYSAIVLVTLPSAPDHRPPRLASAR
ncbi:uncharacterized protein TNCV_385701 [Trichonephila clavipes]|nr:uncharacterized protein TNCV_385701 [Trichonephila clavipes]